CQCRRQEGSGRSEAGGERAARRGHGAIGARKARSSPTERTKEARPNQRMMLAQRSKRMHRRWTMMMVLGAASAVFLPSLALAAPPPAQVATDRIGAAQELYDQAWDLYVAKKYSEACARYEKSEQLDHRIITSFQLADCYEQMGRIASAWTLFTKVADE